MFQIIFDRYSCVRKMYHLLLTGFEDVSSFLNHAVEVENYLKYYLWASTPFINDLLVAIEIWTELYHAVTAIGKLLPKFYYVYN